MLSIPRDLWVIVPGFGEDRINTAHFYAEAQQPGSGPEAALLTVRQNFGIDVDHYVRIRFEGFREVVDALGGVDIELTEPMAGYPPGKHHLTGRKALAFVRNRQGSDDFFRMQQGQFLLKEVFKDILNPLNWARLPAVILAITRSVDTNLPIWTWPRLGLTLLRAGPDGIDNRTINREMTTPFFTEQGANVLLPNWAMINPVLLEMYGQ
jgi:LCP family protein required for cell wall assembly